MLFSPRFASQPAGRPVLVQPDCLATTRSLTASTAGPSPCSSHRAAIASRLDLKARPEGDLRPHEPQVLQPARAGDRLMLESVWLMLELVWLMLESVWLRLDSVWLRLESTWLKLESVWLRLESIWFKLESIWLRLASDWSKVESDWFKLESVSLRVEPFCVMVRAGYWLRLESIWLKLESVSLMLESFCVIVRPGWLKIQPASAGGMGPDWLALAPDCWLEPVWLMVEWAKLDPLRIRLSSFWLKLASVWLLLESLDSVWLRLDSLISVWLEQRLDSSWLKVISSSVKLVPSRLKEFSTWLESSIWQESSIWLEPSIWLESMLELMLESPMPPSSRVACPSDSSSLLLALARLALVRRIRSFWNQFLTTARSTPSLAAMAAFSRLLG